jgi:hypothetical protein
MPTRSAPEVARLAARVWVAGLHWPRAAPLHRHGVSVLGSRAAVVASRPVGTTRNRAHGRSRTKRVERAPGEARPRREPEESLVAARRVTPAPRSPRSSPPATRRRGADGRRAPSAQREGGTSVKELPTGRTSRRPGPNRGLPHRCRCEMPPSSSGRSDRGGSRTTTAPFRPEGAPRCRSGRPLRHLLLRHPEQANGARTTSTRCRARGPSCAWLVAASRRLPEQHQHPAERRQPGHCDAELEPDTPAPRPRGRRHGGCDVPARSLRAAGALPGSAGIPAAFPCGLGSHTGAARRSARPVRRRSTFRFHDASDWHRP